MQENIDLLTEAGVKLYAVSYDNHAAQAAYAEGQNISFTMLSDPDSRVIRDYGVLNTEIPEDEALFQGIPFPGTFLIDEQGFVSDKLFGRHLAARDTAETIVDRALGRTNPGDSDPIATFSEDDGIEVVAFLRGGGGKLRIGPRRRLIVRFSLPPGIHIYDSPVPEGMVGTTIAIEMPEGIREESRRQPDTKPLLLPGIDTPLQVWEGEVDFEYTIFANSDIGSREIEPGTSVIDLGVEVRYQACDDAQCFIPKTRRLSLEVPVAKIFRPNFDAMKEIGGTAIEMDTATHFKELSDRQAARAESGKTVGDDER